MHHLRRQAELEADAMHLLLEQLAQGHDQTRMLEILNVSTGRNFNTEVVLQEHVVR